AATVLTTRLEDPYGYGRIVRDKQGHIERIVEERDASGDERAIHEVNSGIFAFAIEPLFESLARLEADNTQSEYYLTDLVGIYRNARRTVHTLVLDDSTQLRGVNTRVDLADLDRVVRGRKNQSLMLDGITLEDPTTTYIDEDVSIGVDSHIGPMVQLQ